MITTNSDGGYDSVLFDRKGNIIEQRNEFGFSMAEFHGNHFPKRILVGPDMIEHYMVSYDSSSDVIIQQFITITNHQEVYLPDNLDYTRTYFSVFLFDDTGRILKEINIKEHYVDYYEYENENLFGRTRFDLAIEKPIESWKYFYLDDRLNRVEEFYEGGVNPILNRIIYFGDKKLDSMQIFRDNGSLLETLVPQYVYY